MTKCPSCGGKLKASYYPVPIGGWRCVLFCDKSKYELVGGGIFYTKKDAYKDALEKIINAEKEEENND